MSDLRDEDDFTHYFNATARLSGELATARSRIETLEAVYTAYVPKGPGGNAGMALTIGKLHKRLERGRAAERENTRLREVVEAAREAAEHATELRCIHADELDPELDARYYGHVHRAAVVLEDLAAALDRLTTEQGAE